MSGGVYFLQWHHTGPSQMVLVVKNLPANAGDKRRVLSLGWKNSMEKGRTHSTILAWIIPWTEEPGDLWSMGSQRIRHD